MLKAVDLILDFRYPERIADHAATICEDIAFIIEGRIIKHMKHERT